METAVFSLPFRIPLKLASVRSSRILLGRFPSLCNHSAAPLALKPRSVRPSYPFPPFYNMPSIHRIPPSNNKTTSDVSMRDATPMLKFQNMSHFDSPASNSDMIFPLEFDDGQQFSPELAVPWDSGRHNGQQSYLSESSASPLHPFDFNSPHTNALFDSGQYTGMPEMQSPDDNGGFFSQWLKEPECPPLDNSSSPIPIRTSTSVPQTPPQFHEYVEQFTFPQDASFSPSDFAALHPLPRSASPSLPGFPEDTKSFPAFDNACESSLQPPVWASQLWDTPSRSHSGSPASPRSPPHSPLSKSSYALKRQSLDARTRKSSLGQVFQSSSAPSPVQYRAPNLARPYSRRAESVSVSDDRDATVRRKKRLTSPEASGPTETASDSCTFSYHISTVFIYRHKQFSAIQVPPTTAEACTLCLAVVFYRLDLQASSDQHSEAECRTGSQGGWSRIRFAYG
jgi:hypothetical protein